MLWALQRRSSRIARYTEVVERPKASQDVVDALAKRYPSPEGHLLVSAQSPRRVFCRTGQKVVL